MVLRFASSAEYVEYGCPSKLMFVRSFLNLSTLEMDRNANIRAKIVAIMFDKTNNFSLNMDGDIADRTPRIPHKRSMIPHQIP